MRVPGSAAVGGPAKAVPGFEPRSSRQRNRPLGRRKPTLAAQYHRLVPRRGGKKATLAVAHTILVIVYHLLTRQQSYQELGSAYFDERERHAVERRLIRRLEGLGYRVALEPVA